MERVEVLNDYYASHNEDARFTSRNGTVEFLTTVHYIEKYLTPGAHILEIGAGTGRYSHHFARKGYCVDAVELTDHNIDIFKANTYPGENITIRQGDAVDLEDISSEEYDITLLLGPMYHLYTDKDREAAMSEAIRVTKKDGIVFAAYCNSDMTMYQFCFGKNMIKEVIQKNKIDIEKFKLYSSPEDIFQLYRREDIDELMSHFRVERLHYIGTDMLTQMLRICVDDMDDETFDIYMRYNLNICERPDMVGATDHILDIFRKV